MTVKSGAPLLAKLKETGFFSELNYHFGLFAGRLCANKPPGMDLLAALVSRQNEAGHICLRLDAVAALADEMESPDLSRAFSDIDADGWREIAEKSGLCAHPQATAAPPLPFVLTPDDRLYLSRYWDYETRLARAIRKRLPVRPGLDYPLVKAGLSRLFPGNRPGPDRQKLAAAAVAVNAFTIVSGGPGTGKTTTIARLLAILLSASDRPLRIAVTAPTGKAAMRAREAIAGAVRGESFSGVPEKVREALLKTEPFTIHRLLGYRTGSPFFRHDAGNPLPYDIVIADESSMIDIALMTKLVEAVPQDARLILLGDRDQLSSVEAGAVFGDICGIGERGFSASFKNRLAALGAEPPGTAGGPACNDNLITLSHSYRFEASPLIGRVIAAIKAADGNGCMELMTRENGPVRLLVPGKQEGLRSVVERELEHGLADYLKAIPGLRDNPDAALKAFGRFRILCARRSGPQGVAAVNAVAEQWFLRKSGTHRQNAFYPGRPVLILENSYDINLFNGDAGVALGDGSVAFPTGNGGCRRISASRLPAHATLFAMTIHKSQGSEFDRVLVLLPDKDSPLLTRELIYTAVSRAGRECVIRADKNIFRSAVARPTVRNSGLREAVWESR